MRVNELIEEAADVGAVVRRHATLTPERQAVADMVGHGPEGSLESWSYARLHEQARTVAAWLQERYEPGTRVMLLYPVNRHFVGAFLGCLYASMIAVVAPLPGEFRHHRHRIRVVAGDADVSAVLTDAANLAKVHEWAATHELDDVEFLATDTAGYADPAHWRESPVDRDTLALLQYTSGSTGDAKGVMVSHGNLLSNATAFGQGLGWRTPPRFGGWIPLFHDMGLSLQLIPALLLGSANIMMEPTAFVRNPFAWLDAIGRYDITSSAAPNFAYDLCLRRVTDEQIARLDLSRWDFAINASEPVRMSSMTDFTKRFAAAGFREDAFVPLYGLAESTVFTSATAGRAPLASRVDADALSRGEFRLAGPGDPARTVVSCGKAWTTDVRVVNPETGAPLPAGRVGEVWLRGPSITGGYWRNESATDRAFRATSPGDPTEFLRTGDLGVYQDDELYITGRSKEVLIVRGRNLYPHDIEHELRSQHPELGNVGAVFCVPADTGEADGEPGEDELVVTHEIRGMPEELMPALAVAMKQTVAKEFGVSVAAVLLVSSGAVRRTTSGKIQRSEMRELYLAGEIEARYPARP